ncbi:PAP2 superfamily protein [Kribbella orskensis]|uniref:PAP2 superfamily protein n=1 Tax=Kribbella orskensis TaxID=2512216 RepID=A0ABY2B8G3_9ACTN|nr:MULTISPECIES: phosphatase PAP2 family protein [Kribbella]TCN31162.1 PAP2 superfamily protein [Kribbella sp. VKM Ac-2500]TCO11668.1 PAP2 superfamily protein [Kribbella orskensis]
MSVRLAGARRRRVAREVVVILAAIGLYFGVRGLIETRVDLAYRNAERIIELEQSAGIFTEPEMQNAIADHGWLVDAVSNFYIYGHWPVLSVTLLWLMIRHRHEYSRFRNAMLISGAIGLLIFAVFPVAPPRFLTGYGFVDTVTEQTSAYRVLQPPAFVNQYAAVPSLHFGWNLLIGIAWANLAGHWIARLFGWLMPPAMLASIVLTANHYLLDGLVGGAIALLALVAANHLARRHHRPPMTPGPRPAPAGRAERPPASSGASTTPTSRCGGREA